MMSLFLQDPEIKNYSVVDIVADPDTKIRESFFDCLAQIQKDKSHRNWKNYVGLEYNYKQYVAFHVLFYKDKLIAFSGIQTKGFAEGVARVLSRTYYVPEVRRKGLQKALSPSYASLFFLHKQVQICQSLNFDHALVSTEFLRRRVFLSRWVDYVNLGPSPQKWILLEGMYLTCANAESKNCWQNVACLNLSNKKLDMPHISIQEWQKRFN